MFSFIFFILPALSPCLIDIILIFTPGAAKCGVGSIADMLPAILPMYVPMVLFVGIHFVMLLAGRTRYPRWMLAFHSITWNVLLVTIPNLAQAMQVPAATRMFAMSQSSSNSSVIIWCIAAAIYEKKHL